MPKKATTYNNEYKIAYRMKILERIKEAAATRKKSGKHFPITLNILSTLVLHYKKMIKVVILHSSTPLSQES